MGMIFIGIGFGIFYWIVDSAMYALVFHHGTFAEQLLSPDTTHAWERLLAMLIVIAFGIYTQFIINKRKRVEETLRESEVRYRNLFENAHDMIQSVAPDGQFIFVNTAWLETLGYTEAELPDLNLFKIIHPESLPHCQEMFSKIMAGESVNNVQATFVAKDGSPILVEGNVAGRYIGNKLVATQGIFRDITGGKQVEQQLHLQSTALEAAAVAIVITNREGTINWTNPAFTRLTGYIAEEAIGRNPRLLKSGKQDQSFYQNMWDTITSGQVWHGELINRRKDGSLYTEEKTITPVRDSSGNITNFIDIKQDVTERKRVEEMKTEFVSIVSHELRTPLTSIKGFVDLVLEGDSGEINELQNEFLSIAQSETNRLSSLVDDLLDIGRIETGRLKLEIEPISLNELIEGAITSLQTMAIERGIKFTTNISKNPLMIKADRSRIKQVLVNLFSNAIKYNRENGQVEVVARQTEDMVQTDVRDTGEGIPSSDLPHIFGKFYRAQTNATKETHGTGLGLSIAKTVVELHRGKIWVESKEGKGSTFSFTIPVA